jgi:hypothetical protein
MPPDPHCFGFFVSQSRLAIGSPVPIDLSPTTIPLRIDLALPTALQGSMRECDNGHMSYLHSSFDILE